MNVANNEASDIQNIDFNKFGSILKRNGFSTLNSSAITNTPNSDGLHWFEFTTSGATSRFAINVADGKLFKMDDLDGTWDDITGGLTITADNFCSFSNFLNKVFVTNGTDTPFSWDGSTAATVTLPTNVTKPKFNVEFENFLFYVNITLSGTLQSSRFYWSNIKDTSIWSALDFIDISKDDGQQITGAKVLSDRLVIYKERSIYNVFFTGDSSIPFIVSKSNSAVGCIAPFSIQELKNGHVFLSYDGLYFYDGKNSFKISEKITTTLDSYNTTRFDQARSMVQKEKDRYWLALPDSSSTDNDKVVVWDFFNNAFSIYSGIDASAMATFYISGIEERPYFADYGGFVYRTDDGSNDNPAGVSTAINAFYKTNWKPYGDTVNKKAITQTVMYFQNSNSTLTLAYSYDFEDGAEFTQTFSLATSSDVYGSGVYGTATYAGSGGDVIRRDLTSRGRVVRFEFSNATLSETFQVDGFGTYPHLETTE